MLVAILSALLAAAVTGAFALVVALWRARRGVADFDRLTAEGRRTLEATIAEATSAHTEEIRRVLAQARAETSSELAAEERLLSEERRATFAEREHLANDRLVDAFSTMERRLDERLRGFSQDLDRGERHFEEQIKALDQRRRHDLVEIHHRLASDAADVGSTADEQRRVILRIREELERAANLAVREALDDLEAQTVERRRAIEDITERLRTREAATADAIEKTETDVRTRVELMLAEWERRQTERLDRMTEREVERHLQIATHALDERLREAREDAISGLSRELDRTIDRLAREGVAVLLAHSAGNESERRPEATPTPATSGGRERLTDHE